MKRYSLYIMSGYSSVVDLLGDSTVNINNKTYNCKVNEVKRCTLWCNSSSFLDIPVSLYSAKNFLSQINITCSWSGTYYQGISRYIYI